MTPQPASPSGSDPAALETILFACLDVAPSEQEAALAAACRQHPAMAEALRRCWQRIRQLQPTGGLPTQIAGHRILRRLGGGGMGVVYLAEQERLHRKVALKLIRSDLLESAAARERFQREAYAASRVEHPGLCPVFEVGEADGVPFMVMPYFEGVTLAARLAELAAARGVASASMSSASRDLVSVVAAVARAAHHAHEHGLVHRDIKPGNVMLLPDGRPMLLDFGLARDTTGDEVTLTRTGERVGTPAYMAPEQLRGESAAIDRRTDVYALGIVLYEVALLERPFDGSDVLMLREQVASGIRPAALRRRVPYDLASIILKAADPDPARRFPTAAALADDLERFLRLEPVSARRLGGVARVVRWARRYPVVAALLVALAVALGFAGVALQSSLLESRRYRSLALQGESRAAERTDAKHALRAALSADELDPTPKSLVQLNRALQADRQLHRWDLGHWVVWVGFSPDRRRILSVTQAGSFHVFDVATKAEVQTARWPDRIRVDGVALAPDGSFLVAGALGKQALLWALASNELHALDKAHLGNVWDVAVSADSSRIYTASSDGSVGRWRATGEREDPFPWQSLSVPVGQAPSFGVRAVRCFGETVMFAGQTEFVVVHGADEPRRHRFPRRVEAGATDIVHAPARERTFVWALGVDGVFAADGKVGRLPGGSFAPSSGHMTSDGDRVALGGRDGRLRIYDLRACGPGIDGIDAAVYREREVGRDLVTAVRFSSDGKRLFAFGPDFALHMFSVEGESLLELHGFNKPLQSLDYDCEHEVLATGDAAGAVCLWDVKERRIDPVEFRVPGVGLLGLAAGASEPVLAYTADARVVAFPADGAEPQWFVGHHNTLLDARVDRRGKRLATGGTDRTARVWDMATRKETWSTPDLGVHNVVGVDFLPDERLLVVCGGNDTRAPEFQVWRIGPAQPEAVWRDPSTKEKLLHGAATRDGRYVIVGSFAGSVRIVPLELGAEPPTFGAAIVVPQPYPVMHVDVAPSGDRFVVAVENEARIFDLGGRQLGPALAEHQKLIRHVRWSADGSHVVTASFDGSARIWNATTGTCDVAVEVGVPSPVWDAQFDDAERVLYTLSTDGLVRGWLLDRAVLRNLPMAASRR